MASTQEMQRRAKARKATQKGPNLYEQAKSAEVLVRCFVTVNQMAVAYDTIMTRAAVLAKPHFTTNQALEGLSDAFITLATKCVKGEDVEATRWLINNRMHQYIPHRQSAKMAVEMGLDGYVFQLSIQPGEGGRVHMEASGGMGCSKAALMANPNFGA